MYIQIVHKLETEDNAARQATCHDLLEAVKKDNLLHHVVFCDESTFQTYGDANKHTYRIRANEQSKCTARVATEHTQSECVDRIRKVEEETITNNVYLDMLERFLELQLRNVWIMDTVLLQNGAPPHFALTVLDYLSHAFPSKWVGSRFAKNVGTAVTIFDPRDFIHWGFVEFKVYQVKVRNNEQFKKRLQT